MADYIYIPNEYKDYRFALGSVGKKPLFCLGINPSTATPEKLDPTVTSVKNRALRAGYDSYIMLNVYPQRATDPRDLHKDLDSSLSTRNIKAISRLISQADVQPHIWLASGILIEKRPYLRDCLLRIHSAVMDYDPLWLHCGQLSKAGHPHHPLYLQKTAPLEPFNMSEYVKFLQIIPTR